MFSSKIFNHSKFQVLQNHQNFPFYFFQDIKIHTGNNQNSPWVHQHVKSFFSLFFIYQILKSILFSVFNFEKKIIPEKKIEYFKNFCLGGWYLEVTVYKQFNEFDDFVLDFRDIVFSCCKTRKFFVQWMKRKLCWWILNDFFVYLLH